MISIQSLCADTMLPIPFYIIISVTWYIGALTASNPETQKNEYRLGKQIMFPSFGCNEQPIPKPKKATNICRCGKAKSSQNSVNRIVNGIPLTEPGKYPWLVSLQIYGIHFCGAAIISNKFILTAAHCIEFKEFDIVIGAHNLMKLSSEPGVLILSPANVKVHEGYRKGEQDNDIALIKLNQTLDLTGPLIPICLPLYSDSPSYQGGRGTIAGWGLTEPGVSKTSPIPREADIEIYSSHYCKHSTGYDESDITDNMICAGDQGKDSCQGDSGGPLIVENSPSYFTVHGIVSWGISCGKAQYPGVYTRVERYVDWIYKKTKGSLYCQNPENS